MMLKLTFSHLVHFIERKQCKKIIPFFFQPLSAVIAIWHYSITRLREMFGLHRLLLFLVELFFCFNPHTALLTTATQLVIE